MTSEAAQSIEDVVKNIIVGELRVDPSQLAPETHLMKDLGADSLDALNIALRLEEAFKIKIPDEAIPRFLTVGDIVKGVQEHLKTN
ncbi:MAG TPA: acyl carrier protein [Blastocatellia bacterium]|nr:acyl carrier protein [Blastocatellia bacterium]